MRLRLLIIILLLCMPLPGLAQADTVLPQTQSPRMRISLLTLGPGTHTLEGLGHVAIRIIDSSRTDEWRDVVFNYGTFNFTEGNFLGSALTGKLNFYLSVFRFDTFMKLFVIPERGVSELEFNLTPQQKLTLALNLQQNAREENKYYKYNFFNDNCSTRIYWMLKNTFGTAFTHQNELKWSDFYYTYYLELPYRRMCKHWETVGAQLLFQSRMHKNLTPVEAISFPLMLPEVLRGAAINGQRLYKNETTLQKNRIPINKGINQPLLFTSILLLLTIAGLYKPLAKLGKAMQTVILMGTGITGCILLWAWQIAHYAGTENNTNLFWALPTNLVVPFLPFKLKKYYTGIALLILLLYLLWTVKNLFEPIASELLPLLLAQAIVYLSMLNIKGLRFSLFRKANTK